MGSKSTDAGEPVGGKAMSIWAFLAAGISIGWLVGLSATPVIQGVISSIVGLTVAVVSAMAGITFPSRDDTQARPKRFCVHPLPVASLVVGLAIGAPLGLYARTHDTFGPNLDDEAVKWEHRGLKREAIYNRFFDRLYPATGHSPTESQTRLVDPTRGALFSFPSAERCKQLRELRGEALRRILSTDADDRVSHFAVHSKDVKSLEEFVDKYLCPSD